MGALVDQCPDCGKFVAKGTTICPHCETVLPEPIEPAPVAASSPERSVGVALWKGVPWGAARVLAGAAFGALLAVMALTAGAGDVGTLSGDPEASRDAASIVEATEPPTEPQQPQTPSAETEPSAPTEPAAGFSPERRAQLRATIAAIRDALADWPELYQISHGELAKVRRRLAELERLIDEIPQRKE